MVHECLPCGACGSPLARSVISCVARASVREHRARLELGLTPQLRQALQDKLPRVYTIARRNAKGALRDHGEPAAADALPTTCTYTLDQITADWWP